MTTIEWTDKVWLLPVKKRRLNGLRVEWQVLQNPSLFEQSDPVRYAASRREPLVEVAVPLAAVAALTCGHDVPRLGAPTTGHRDYVVPRLSRCVAVGAEPVKVLKQILFSARRYSIYPAPSLRRSLLSIVPKGRVGRVSMALGSTAAGRASATPHLILAAPRLAPRTPSEASGCGGPTLALRRPGTRDFVAASTGCRQSIRAACVGSEVATERPRAAPGAPLLAEEDMRRVLGHRDPEAGGGGLGRSPLTSHGDAA